MPDYDPKSIPILDDIIEDKKTDTQGETPDDAISIDIAVDKIDQDDSTLDLFDQPAEDFSSVDADTTNLDAETTEPEIGSIDRFIGTTDAEEIETETAESALIDYHPEIEDNTDDSLDRHEAQQDDFKNIEELSAEPDQPVAAQLAAQPVELETIVDDVVKQLLPDLEQQLRFLVQQALEEKLPAEMIEQISEDKND